MCEDTVEEERFSLSKYSVCYFLLCFLCMLCIYPMDCIVMEGIHLHLP